MATESAEIGVYGGSGFYSLMENPKEVWVETPYGAPSDKLVPAGGDSARHPTINRWVYPSYIVYFERDHVINSVAQRATPNEIGPKGAVQQQ